MKRVFNKFILIPIGIPFVLLGLIIGFLYSAFIAGFIDGKNYPSD